MYNPSLPSGPAQPGAYVYQYPPPRKSRSGCLIIAAAAVVMGLLLVCLVGITVWALAEPIQQALAEIWPAIAEVPQGTPVAPDGGGTALANDGAGTALAASSGDANLITAPSGAMIAVPVAAVPFTDEGEAGTMVFSIEEQQGSPPMLAEGLEVAGAVYNLGPEGFNFNQPVMISLPIPAGVSPEEIVGLVTYDAADGQWKLTPSFVDAEAGLVSASTIHLSPWAVARASIGGFYENLARWQHENGGEISVHLPRTYPESFSFPDGLENPQYNGRAFSYGVCIEAYTLDDNNPATRIWPHWDTPTGYLYTVHDSYHGLTLQPGPRTWWLPSGSFTLSEIVTVSEVNPGNPLYVPKYANFWRPLGNIQVDPGSQRTYSFRDVQAEFTTWTRGRPNCFGAATTSVGTGDVQITLTWHSNDDIDLYVVDPTGFEIFYASTDAPSGGRLDRDNKCADMQVGRPENIFWPTGAAPAGQYQVRVHYFGACQSEQAVDWTVRIVTSGRVETFNGRLTTVNEMQTVTTFTLP